eukprot:2716415-Rhodomonas_salina.1
MYTKIDKGHSQIGVMMFVRNDMTAKAQRIQVHDEYEDMATGRLLQVAMQLQGVGSNSAIVVTAVYMPVNAPENHDETLDCLRTLMEIRNRCAAKHIPIVACSDWNATTCRGQHFGYSSDGWKKGDEMF